LRSGIPPAGVLRPDCRHAWAARRATNAILAVAGIDAPPCEFWEFDVPRPMQHAQFLDRVRLKMGLPNLIEAASP
jgi:hypothetical protein